jgi:hypothetical protein
MMTSLYRCVAALALVLPLALATEVKANPTGGALGGVNRAPALGAGVHRIVYNGGEQADFSVVGDGDTTLNVIVKDANGVEIVRTRGPGDRCHVSWQVGRTGAYYIYVVNEGVVYNQYTWRAF